MEPVGWLRSHWKATAIAIVLFLSGVGLGAAGAEDPAGDPSEVAIETAEGTTVTVRETVEGEAQTVTVTETVEPSAEATIPGDGVFLVGDDVRPGTYRTGAASSGNCYWARLKGTSGNFGDIIANGNSSGPVTVTIARSDVAFMTQGCDDWTMR